MPYNRAMVMEYLWDEVVALWMAGDWEKARLRGVFIESVSDLDDHEFSVIYGETELAFQAAA